MNLVIEKEKGQFFNKIFKQDLTLVRIFRENAYPERIYNSAGLY
jgi:hypothetical protein